MDKDSKYMTLKENSIMEGELEVEGGLGVGNYLSVDAAEADGGTRIAWPQECRYSVEYRYNR
jgi:hypothetical protein